MSVLSKVAIVAMVLLTACSTSSKISSVGFESAGLKFGESVAITIPEDSGYETITGIDSNNMKTKYVEHPGSGILAAQTIRNVFMRHSRSVEILSGCQDSGCLDEENAKNFYYLVILKLDQWEERNTPYSGSPDKVKLKLEIYKSADKKQLGVVNISVESASMTLTDDTVSNLLLMSAVGSIKQLYH